MLERKKDGPFGQYSYLVPHVIIVAIVAVVFYLVRLVL